MLPVRTGLIARCRVTTATASPVHTTVSPATPAMQNVHRSLLNRLVGGFLEYLTPRTSGPRDTGFSDLTTGVAQPGLRAGAPPRTARARTPSCAVMVPSAGRMRRLGTVVSLEESAVEDVRSYVEATYRLRDALRSGRVVFGKIAKLLGKGHGLAGSTPGSEA